jgi:hypothetical protein
LSLNFNEPYRFEQDQVEVAELTDRKHLFLEHLEQEAVEILGA